jgi:hypothetical protein
MSITYTRNPKFYPQFDKKTPIITYLFTDVDNVLYTVVDKYSLKFGN